MTNFDDLHCRAFEESDARKKQKHPSANNGAFEEHDKGAPTGKNGEEPKREGADADEAKTEKKTARPTQAELLIALARDSVELLFHHQDRAYADIRVDGHRETWPVNSPRFRQWLRRLYYAEHQKVPNAEAVQQALDQVEGAASFDGEEHQVELRVAGHAGRIYIDLGDPDWRAIEIDEDDWRVIDDPPVRFRRPRGLRALPEPTRGGDISTLRGFVNVKDDPDFVLLVCWLLAAMRDRGPYPVLAISGEQGTAKSTLVAILRALLDPNASPLRALPREDRDLFIAASNGWLLAFDNVSGLPAGISDTLCRLATGGGFAVRQLYTDQDEVLFDASRPIVLNGIGDMVGRADLADRAIFITLEPISETDRRAEDELWTHIRRELPRILGVLCSGISHGLRHRDIVKLERLPRMADFAKWGAACEGAFWPAGTFQAAYDDNQHSANDAVLDADEVGLAVRAFMQTRLEWEGTPTDFRTALEAHQFPDDKHRPKGWPTTASDLSIRLRRAATSLRRAGIGIECSRGGGKRRKRKIRLICRTPSAEHDNSQNSPAAPSAWARGGEKQSKINDFEADSDFREEPPASRPACPPRADTAGIEPKTVVRPNRLEDNKVDRADGAGGDFGPISENRLEEDDGLGPPRGATCAECCEDGGEALEPEQANGRLEWLHPRCREHRRIWKLIGAAAKVRPWGPGVTTSGDSGDALTADKQASEQ